MSDPIVSILIAAFNEEDRIRNSLDSVLTQTYPHVEVIVVDDGSTDRTAEIVREEYPNVTLIRQENAGLPTTRNRAAEASSGELLMAMDADDRIKPEKTERQLEVLIQNPDAAAVATNAIAHCGDRVYPFTNVKLPRISETTVHDVLCGPRPVGASIMVWREAFENVGGYDTDPTIRYWDDSDLFCRLIMQGHKLLFLNEPLYIINHHPSNISSKSYATRAQCYIAGCKKLDPRLDHLPWSSALTEADYSWYQSETIIVAAFSAYREKDRRLGMRVMEEIDDLPAAPLPARVLRTVARTSWPAFGLVAAPYYLWLRVARTRRVWGTGQGLLQLWRRFIR